MAEPRIYTKNYIMADDAFTISHGSATKAYLYDRDLLTKWLSSGANSDATTVTIEIAFFEGTTAISRTIDTLMLLNHNFKTWTAEYWDGSAWQSWTSETGNTGSNSIKTGLASVTTLKIKLTCAVTIIADAEKFIGELIVCKLQLNIGEDIARYDPEYREKRKELILGDGSMHCALGRVSTNRMGKYGVKGSFELVPTATKESLKTIKESGQPFLWYPESTAVVDEIFYVHWTGKWKPSYTIQAFKSPGYTVPFEFEEV